MLYYPNAPSKANRFCIETTHAIWNYLETHRGADPRATFIDHDLKVAGILIPKGGLRMLRERGWLQRLGPGPRGRGRVWRLSESARRWLEEQGGTYPPEAV